jgi:hypothetical protein
MSLVASSSASHLPSRVRKESPNEVNVLVGCCERKQIWPSIRVLPCNEAHGAALRLVVDAEATNVQASAWATSKSSASSSDFASMSSIWLIISDETKRECSSLKI